MASDQNPTTNSAPPPSTLSPRTTPSTTPITVPLSALLTNSISPSTLESAFGPSSLGIILISHLPPTFPTLRHKLLSFASHLAHLPNDTLSDLTVPSAKYLVGWSHGRETLPPKSLPDFHKGSFYVNCAFVTDPELDAAPVTEGWEGFGEYTEGNVWPDESAAGMDGMEGFRETFEQMARLVVDVAGLVARSVDRYAEGRVEGYPSPVEEGEGGSERMGYLERVVRGSYTTKARLLHYFPPDQGQHQQGGRGKVEGQDGEEEKEEDDDAWCTTHLDHGCLTGLLSAMYLDSTQPLPARPALPEPIPCPDPTAGLYIHSRTGEAVKVSIPADCLAFQTGEALQKITDGKFKAVPHYVSPGRRARKGGKGLMDGIERNTLAIFTQPNLDDVVDRSTGECFGGFARGVVKRNTVQG